MKTLFKFQQQALDTINNLKFAGLFLDMGLGKTLTSLHWLRNKNSKNPTIILCQSKKVIDWKNEALETLDHKYNIIAIKKGVEFKKALEQLKNWDVIIISYQIFSKQFKDDKSWYINNKWNLLVDESQSLKAYNSKISRNVLKFKNHCEYLLLLSGDPISTGYKDLFVQMKVLKLFHDEYTHDYFMLDYCKIRHHFNGIFTIPLIIGYKKVDKLLKILDKVTVQVKTEHAYDLPQQWIINKEYKPSNAYLDFEKNSAIPLNQYEIIAPKNPLHEMNMLRQLASGFLHLEDRTLDTLENPKIELLKELLLEMDHTTDIVIFYNFNKELEQIKQLLRSMDKTFKQINGSVSDDINSSLKPTIWLVQYLAGAKGIDGLQHKSNRIIYYSPTLSGELYKQSLKRIHRIGQNNNCTYFRLIGKKSIEADIYKSLEKSQDYTEEIFLKRKK